MFINTSAVTRPRSRRPAVGTVSMYRTPAPAPKAKAPVVPGPWFERACILAVLVVR